MLYILTEDFLKKKLIPFIIELKIIKYLWINLTKEVKDLYSENYKESKEDTSKWNGILCCGGGGLEEQILLKC